MSNQILPYLWLGRRTKDEEHIVYDRSLICDTATQRLRHVGVVVVPLPNAPLSQESTTLVMQAAAAVTGWTRRRLRVLLVSGADDERAELLAAIILMGDPHLSADEACTWLRSKCGKEVLPSTYYRQFLAQFETARCLPRMSGCSC